MKNKLLITAIILTPVITQARCLDSVDEYTNKLKNIKEKIYPECERLVSATRELLNKCDTTACNSKSYLYGANDKFIRCSNEFSDTYPGYTTFSGCESAGKQVQADGEKVQKAVGYYQNAMEEIKIFANANKN